jgi:hypothetical protein
VMADLSPHGTSSSREGSVAENSSSDCKTGEADAATRPASAEPALPAALDELRDAAKAHDGQLPRPGIPLLADRGQAVWRRVAVSTSVA